MPKTTSQTGIRHRLIATVSRETYKAGLDNPQPSYIDLADASAIQIAYKAGLDEETVASIIAETTNITRAEDILSRPSSAEFLEKVPINFARRHGMLGLASNNGVMPVAIHDLCDMGQIDILSRFLGRPIRPVLASAQDITTAINSAYQQRTGQAQTLIDADSVDKADLLAEMDRLREREDLLDVSSRAPVIKLVNLILFEAVKMQASDVHVQPYEDRLMIRTRIDGILFNSYKLKKGMQEEIVSRVKIMGRMNIAEKRLPQDGRATVQVGDRIVDLRIASLPTSFGERIVIRLLDKSARLYTLGELGMQENTRNHFREQIGADHGIILVTGPTGSGKSSTLYAALTELNSEETNVLTLEDPIEYQLHGISQTQINEKKGMTFASGLRNVLRQDPDIIMVGEIRDHDTAVMAIQSALTGHLVFSTLHTNDAASAVTRLLDLGIESYLVASSVSAVLAQRLVRRVCTECAEPFKPAAAELKRLGINPKTVDISRMQKGKGCEVCRNTGYRGRIGIFELLIMNADIRSLIQTQATAGQIKDAAVNINMQTLAQDGIVKVLAGITTIEEVFRVIMRATV